jgi:hypothetical protein
MLMNLSASCNATQNHKVTGQQRNVTDEKRSGCSLIMGSTSGLFGGTEKDRAPPEFKSEISLPELTC